MMIIIMFLIVIKADFHESRSVGNWVNKAVPQLGEEMVAH